MGTVSLTVDGEKVEARAGQYIVQAAGAAGIYVPTLCYHPNLIPANKG